MHNVLLYIVILLCLSGCRGNKTKAPESPLYIFAASGSRPLVEMITEKFHDATGIGVTMNYAASGTLARQIQHGAEADIFISAHREWMDFLVGEEMISAERVERLAGSSLVIISPEESGLNEIQALENGNLILQTTGNIALGDPDFVPVGKYAKTALMKMGWWSEISDRIVLGKDVSSVLKYVELGEVDWGMVYKSEALQSDKVSILAEIPDSLHEDVQFYIATPGTVSQETEILISLFLNEKEGYEIRGFK